MSPEKTASEWPQSGRRKRKGGGGGGFDTRRGWSGGSWHLEKEKEHRDRGSARGLNEAQLQLGSGHSSSSNESQLRAAPHQLSPHTFHRTAEAEEGGEEEWEDKWTGRGVGVGRGSDSRVVPFVQSQTLPSSAATAAVHKKEKLEVRKRGKEGEKNYSSHARAANDAGEIHKVEQNPTSPLTGESKKCSAF